MLMKGKEDRNAKQRVHGREELPFSGSAQSV